MVADSLHGCYTIATAWLERRVIGAIFLINLGDRLFAIWGGAPIRFRHLRVNHALWWACMKLGIEHHCRYLNMGRSLKGSGLEFFLRNAGVGKANRFTGTVTWSMIEVSMIHCQIMVATSNIGSSPAPGDIYL
jgi:hypothetical protein